MKKPEEIITQELVEKIARQVAQEVAKEFTAVQIKADAKSIVDLGLNRLGFKKNWTEIGIVAGVSYVAGTGTGLLLNFI